MASHDIANGNAPWGVYTCCGTVHGTALGTCRDVTGQFIARIIWALPYDVYTANDTDRGTACGTRGMLLDSPWSCSWVVIYEEYTSHGTAYGPAHGACTQPNGLTTARPLTLSRARLACHGTTHGQTHGFRQSRCKAHGADYITAHETFSIP